MFPVCRNLWIDEVRSRSVRRDAATRPELTAEQVVHGEAVAHGEIAVREVEQAMQSLAESSAKSSRSSPSRG